MKFTRLNTFVFVPLCWASGLLFYALGSSVSEESNASLEWQPVSATMQSAEVEKVVDRSEFLNTKTRYYVHPTYRFFVGEKHYTGYTLSIPWSRWFAEEKQAQEYAKKLMATPDLKVYFDPKDPNKSCIYRGKKDGGRKFQKVGLVIALTGTFYGIFIWPILVVGLTSLIKRS